MVSMHAIRNQLRQRQSWLCWLLLCVLFRAVIPIGFMPGTAGTGNIGSLIALCYGDSGSAQLLSLSQPKHSPHMAHHADHHVEHQQQHQQPEQHSKHKSADHSYCLFAGVVLNATGSVEHPVFDTHSTINQYIAPRPNFFAAHPFQLPFSRAPPHLSVV